MIGSLAKIWLLEYDADFCDFVGRYRRGDWKNIVIKGRGGTRMDLAQKWVIQNRISADAVIMLTDGITPWCTEPMPMPFLVCLTRDMNVPSYAQKILMPVG